MTLHETKKYIYTTGITTGSIKKHLRFSAASTKNFFKSPIQYTIPVTIPVITASQIATKVWYAANDENGLKYLDSIRNNINSFRSTIGRGITKWKERTIAGGKIRILYRILYIT